MLLTQFKRNIAKVDLERFMLVVMIMMLITQVAALFRQSSHPLYYLVHGVGVVILLILSIWWGTITPQKRISLISRIKGLPEHVVVSLIVTLFLLGMSVSAYMTHARPTNLFHPSATYACIVISAIALAIIRDLRLQTSNQYKWLSKRSTWMIAAILLIIAVPFQILLWWSHGLPQGEQWLLHLDAEGYMYYAYQILGIVDPQPPTFLVRPPGYPLLLAFFLTLVGDTETWILSLANAIMLSLIPAMVGLIMCRFVRPVFALLVGMLSLGHEISWSYIVLGGWRTTTFVFITVVTIMSIVSYDDKGKYKGCNLLMLAWLVAIRTLVRLHGAVLVLIIALGMLMFGRIDFSTRAKQVAIIAASTILPLLVLHMYHGTIFGSPGLSLESVTAILDSFPTEEGVENPDTAEIRYIHSFLPEANYSDFFRVDMGYDLMFLRAYEQGIPYPEFAKTAHRAGWQIIAANIDEYARFSSKNLMFHLFYPGFGKRFFNFHDIEYPPKWDEPRPKCLPDFLHIGKITNEMCDEWKHALQKMQRRPIWYQESTDALREVKDKILIIVQSMFGRRNYFKGIVGLLGSAILLTQTRTRFMGFVIGSMLVSEIVPHAAFAPTQPRYTYVPQVLSLIASSLGAMVLVDLCSGIVSRTPKDVNSG